MAGKNKGRKSPSFYGEPMRLVTFYMPQFMRDWLDEQPESLSATIRDLIQREMDKEERSKAVSEGNHTPA